MQRNYDEAIYMYKVCTVHKSASGEFIHSTALFDSIEQAMFFEEISKNSGQYESVIRNKWAWATKIEK